MCVYACIKYSPFRVSDERMPTDETRTADENRGGALRADEHRRKNAGSAPVYNGIQQF